MVITKSTGLAGAMPKQRCLFGHRSSLTRYLSRTHTGRQCGPEHRATLHSFTYQKNGKERKKVRT